MPKGIAMSLDVKIAKSLKVNSAGSGSIHVQGKAKSLDLKNAGSGKFEGESLEVEDADIKLTGSGKIYISCKDELNAKVSGSGKLYYKGNPSKIDTKVNGSGKIEKL